MLYQDTPLPGLMYIAALRSKVVICSYWVWFFFLFGPGLAITFFITFHVLQSSVWGRGSWLLYFSCIFAVMCVCLCLPVFLCPSFTVPWVWYLIFAFGISLSEFIKSFSCSTQLSMKVIMLINVKMPTIVGILTCVSMINTTQFYVSLKARKLFFAAFLFTRLVTWNSMLSWVEHEKS